MYKYLLITIGLVLLTSLGIAAEDTTDISYILPDSGHFTKETDQWWINYDDATTHLSTSTVFFDSDGIDSYVVLQCNSTKTYTYKPARFGISHSSEHLREVSNVIKDELLFTITFRGSPSSTYGCGTIFGYIQPEINSHYNPTTYSGLRKFGYSPGYNDLISFKCNNVDTTKVTGGSEMFNYGLLCVTTTWQTLTRRIIPTNSNYFQFGMVGVKYNSNGNSYGAKGPYVPTQLQIKEIKLQAIRYY